MTSRRARRGWPGAGAVLSLGLCLTLPAAKPASGQLSPGLLSEPHAHLEGSGHCQDCHEAGKGVDPVKCLGCHELLAARIQAGRGLHAHPEYADCKVCHVDHHGREFELVWWGEEGVEAFDHRRTGFDLEAAHEALGCRDCHRTELLVDAAALAARDKDADRTFLGLGRDCTACHQDPHRGQFTGRSCTDCHSQRSWAPAPGFDHQATQYPLTGRHAAVDCAQCHQPQAGAGGGESRQFLGLAFSSCADCHLDPHRDRFGADCSSCHQTSGWAAVDERRLDHDLTRYPLVGRHRRVECADCHRPGEPRRGLPFERCTDCHEDAHVGQLSGRQGGSACEGCHDLEGFRPASFTVSDHQAAWPLEGAHLAVACDACHRSVDPVELERAGVADPAAIRRSEPTIQLRFAASGCGDCHADPHRVVGDGSASAECTSCHRIDGWRSVAFDHAATGFELRGAHRQLGCAECHTAGGSGSLTFGGLLTTCAGCHADRHRGQLVDANGETTCSRCHSEDSWRPAGGFDHDQDASFRLEGGHRDVPCLSCHPTESAAGEPFVRYRPLAASCAACHAVEEPR